MQDLCDGTGDSKLKLDLLKPTRVLTPAPQNISRRRPRVPDPDFNLTFSELKDAPRSTQIKLNLEEIDEDFPDLDELMKQRTVGKSPSPVSNYSNSEIDALIRDAPIDDLEQELIDSSPGPASPSYAATSELKLVSRRPYYRPATSQSEINAIGKNKHLLSHRNSDSEENYGSPPKVRPVSLSRPNLRFDICSQQKRKREPLFLAGSSQSSDRPSFAALLSPAKNDNISEEQQYRQDDGECFAIDYSLFDVVQEPDSHTDSLPPKTLLKAPSHMQASPPANKRRRSSYVQQPQAFVQQASLNASQSLMKPSAPSFSVTPSNVPLLESESQTLNEAEDPLAELEAWLQSDAVIQM